MTLECASLSVHFGGVVAVDCFSMRLEPHRITALIGPNGAGKTTLVNTITGFLPPLSGRVFLDERDITKTNSFRICRAGISRTFQDLRLAHQLTVIENVLLAYPRQRGESASSAIWPQRTRSDDDNRDGAMGLLTSLDLRDVSRRQAAELSYGQQKLLSIACCIATQASVLILDEPVAGVDPITRAKLFTLISDLSKLGKTVLFIEHDLEAVGRLADSVIVMDEGRKIAEGPWTVVITDATVREAYLA